MTPREKAFRPVQEEDAPNLPKLVMIAVGTLAVFAAGIVCVYLVLQRAGTTPQVGGALPKEIGSAEIGIVDQPIFENDRRLVDLIAAKRAWLDGYGWTDRDAGTVHVPVSRAIDDLLREQGSR
jgi:hypothetical protein